MISLDDLVYTVTPENRLEIIKDLEMIDSINIFNAKYIEVTLIDPHRHIQRTIKEKFKNIRFIRSLLGERDYWQGPTLSR